jgi:hypothetical protein
MEVEDLSTLSLFPLCLHTDPKTGYSYISNPFLTRDKKTNKFYFKCYSKNNEKIEIFYAVIPAYVPLPPSMLVFVAENSKTDPKYTISVRQERDPNIVNLNDRVSFIAWSSIIPYTVPLFLHRLENIVYPSFNEKPPGDLSRSILNLRSSIAPIGQWTQELISPIWVIPEKVQVDGKEILGHELGFICYHGSRCILDPYGVPLLDCINKCNQAVPPENIFHYINRVFLSPKVKSESHRNVKKIIKKFPKWILIIILAIFFILIILLITETLQVSQTKLRKIKNRL